MAVIYTFIAILSSIVILVISLYKINRVRYFFVGVIWKAIDWIVNKIAKKAVLPEGIKVEKDIVYVEDGSLKQLLDIYSPENNKEELPVIIFTHGGGFLAGDKLQTRQYCMTLAKEGYTIFNINYRLAPQNKLMEQVKDVMSAIAWVKLNCHKYCGDKSRIVLAGDSAGAYLTALAANICVNAEVASALDIEPVLTEEEIKGLLLFSGLFDLRTAAKTGFPSIKSDIEIVLGTSQIENYEKIEALSVIKNIKENYPKTFISSGAADWLHSESVELVRTLEEKGTYHQDCLFEKTERKAMHDYQFRMELEPSKQCFKRVIKFLESEIA